jgi:hypothetical protein
MRAQSSTCTISSSGKREPRGDEIEWRAALDERAEGRRAGDAGPVLLEGRARPSAPRRDEVLLGDPACVDRAPGHGLDLGAHAPVALLDAAPEELELEEYAAHGLLRVSAEAA